MVYVTPFQLINLSAKFFSPTEKSISAQPGSGLSSPVIRISFLEFLQNEPALPPHPILLAAMNVSHIFCAGHRGFWVMGVSGREKYEYRSTKLETRISNLPNSKHPRKNPFGSFEIRNLDIVSDFDITRRKRLRCASDFGFMVKDATELQRATVSYFFSAHR